MLKGSIHQDDIKSINIYAPHNRAPKYAKQKWTELKGESDNSVIDGHIDIPLSIMEGTSKQEGNRRLEQHHQQLP